MTEHVERVPIGIWSELPPGARWANEGISRIVGFTIEGGAKNAEFIFHVLVPRGMAETVREDLRSLAATEGVDWQVHEATEAFERDWIASNPNGVAGFSNFVAIMAAYANLHIQVSGWLNTFPHFTGSQLLTQGKAALLPDAIPYDFPIGWDYEHYWSDEGEWVRWLRIAQETLRDAEAVVAHSKHVATRHGVKLLGLDQRSICINPHAPPDLSSLLPFVTNRQKTKATRDCAAAILRRFAEERSISYLRDFPFEEVKFAFVATQERITKNVGRAALAINRMLRRDRVSLKLLMTTPVHWGADWTLLPSLLEAQQLQFDVLSLPDVPREVHAALFHCAEVTIHPSFYEGIVGTLTFYESVSVGTPCIMGRGPHVDELLETEPELEPLVFDPYDVEGMVKLINEVIDNPSKALATQLPAYERRLERGWDQAARVYANAASGKARGGW